MAQSIILKRSSLPGKVPDTGSLNAGELAINTYDGKIFIKRAGNVDSIQSVLTTNSTTTGSITLTQTGSFGELTISQDGNIGRDLYVIRDIITNNDIDAGGDISGSGLQVNDTLNITHEYLTFTGSANLTGSVGVLGDLTVLGAVNARQFNINVISSSVIYQSGSTKFGDTIDDTHQFTGSIDVSGSILINGVVLGASANSGSFTGSFTGSFFGDGSGLRGVVSDDLPIDGWDYDSNSSASISDFNVTSSKYLIDFDWDSQMGTPVGHKTFISNKSGSTQVVPTDSGVKFVVENNVVATIGINGIQATIPAGTVSGSSQLTSSYDTRYVLSGSITQTTWDNIASKPGGIVSGSSQLTSSMLATTGSNIFIGTQNVSGSIIPGGDSLYDLGDITHQFRHLYLSSGSLYIDGTKVLGSANQELQITTDTGQSFKILEAGTDTITLQSADGDIQLKTSGGGNLLFDPTTGLIDVRGTLQIQDGYKITSSGGNSIQLGNDLGITGSISTTGNINGINLSTFSSSLDNRILTEKGRVDAILLASDADKDSFAEIVSLINSVDTSNDGTFASFYTSSVNRLSNIESSTGSYELKGSSIVSGSSQVSFTGIVDKPTLVSGSSQITFSGISSLPTLVSGSSQISGIGNSQLTNNSITIAGTSTSLGSSISLATITNGSGIVSGSSQITMASTTGFGTYINQAVLTSSNPTFAGVKGSAYFDAQANSGFRIRNAADTANAGGWTRRGLWEGNANYDPALWAETGYGMYVYTNGSADIRSYWDTSGHFLPGSNATYNLGSSSNRWNTSYVSRLDINGSHLSGYGILNIVSSDASVISLDSTTSNDVRIRYKTLGVDKWFGGMYTSDNWELRRGSDNGAMFSLTQSGNATLAGTFTENSSLRYKENVETIKYGLDKVLQMRGVTYNKKDNGVKEVGVIAEEVYDVLPEVVLKNEEGEIDSVSYGRIVGVLIEAIKEQQKQIEELKSLIK